MAELLVSVRCVDEADAALSGGAALIDVKEPALGSLGRAEDATIDAVVRHVACRRPVSAALGELVDYSAPTRVTGLSFAKWGLSQCADSPAWRDRLTTAGEHLGLGCRPVAVAYADWQRAGAPTPTDVAVFACRQRWGAFLLDTWMKDGTTLLDWLPLAEVTRLAQTCRRASVPVALAGSLQPEQFAELSVAEPSWFAVRGAVCQAGRRNETICPERVRRLVDALGIA